ncbi:hypothetical protein [Mycolicibacterium porcinum]|uniref:ATP-binding protein n=2 Tax=Mycolicibacterium TaxID=1866885 RepID=A0ABV3VFR9_9MYCO
MTSDDLKKVTRERQRATGERYMRARREIQRGSGVPLSVSVGTDADGSELRVSLTSHLLVTGPTGSGKSVMLRHLAAQLRKRPEVVLYGCDMSPRRENLAQLVPGIGVIEVGEFVGFVRGMLAERRRTVAMWAGPQGSIEDARSNGARMPAVVVLCDEVVSRAHVGLLDALQAGPDLDLHVVITRQKTGLKDPASWGEIEKYVGTDVQLGLREEVSPPKSAVVDCIGGGETALTRPPLTV